MVWTKAFSPPASSTSEATATAQLIGREAGVTVAPLDLLMSSRESPLAGTDLYLSVLAANVSTIQEAYPCA